MKANKDKARRGKGCRAFLKKKKLKKNCIILFLQCGAGPFAASMNLILFLSLRSLNLKNIQGIYSYTRSANFKSVSTPLKK